jgi:hypothetical protein
MTDARTGGGEGHPASMEAVDRKLNVFALANGIDLTRLGDARVLAWYRDGMERGVRVEPGGGDGTWAIRATAAPDGRTPARAVVRTLESALDVGQILSRFKELMAGALDAANALSQEEAEDRT